MCSYTQHTDDGSGTCSVCSQTIGYIITFQPPTAVSVKSRTLEQT